jgi:putative transposase
VGIVAACQALGVARESYYRDRRPKRIPKPRPTPKRALGQSERQEVLDTLHSESFVDKAPAEVYATLLDNKAYLCSTRTMYRILEDNREVRERRNQRRHPTYHKPVLTATAPNQVWSWDITKLLGPVKGNYFCLYLMLDIFSRYAVGWMVAETENAALGQRFIRETLDKHQVLPGTITIHSDRGVPMTATSTAQLMATLGVTKSHSRPHVSNDNPYSEAHFKTLKYRPDFPNRFGSQQHCLSFMRDFIRWYNDEHRHSGIGLLTPASVHFGQAPQILAQRQEVLTAAYETHPERFVRRPPRPPELPTAVWINQPTEEDTIDTVAH